MIKQRKCILLVVIRLIRVDCIPTVDGSILPGMSINQFSVLKRVDSFLFVLCELVASFFSKLPRLVKCSIQGWLLKIK